MKRKKGKKMAATAKVVSFSEIHKKRNVKSTHKKKPVRFSEMSLKNQKETIEALRDD